MGNCTSQSEISSQNSSSTKESSEIEEEIPSFQWSDLPPNVVKRIYSLLERKDQSSMSQVCKTWSREYSSPSLWRHIKFFVPERMVTTDLHPAVRAAQRYGHFFQHVEIVFRKCHFSRLLMERTYRQLILFIQILTKHSQLLSISFINNDSYHSRYAIGDKRRYLVSHFHQTLIALFLTQNHLKSVIFNKMHFVYTFGVELLQTIFASNSAALRNLELSNFWCHHCHGDPNGATSICVPLDTLLNLESLTIDYSVFFETLITNLYEDRSKWKFPNPLNLQTLVLFCGLKENRLYNGIKPRAWKYLATICPFLKMNVTIEVKSENDMGIYVVRDMPIKSLVIKWMPSGVSRLGMTLLRLIESGINKDLEGLSVEVKAGDNLVEDVSSILQTSPKLSELELQVLFLPKCWGRPPRLTPVFECLLESGPISLKKLNITIKTHISSSRISDYYSKVLDKYVPPLKKLGLIVTLSAIRVPFRLGCLVC